MSEDTVAASQRLRGLALAAQAAHDAHDQFRRAPTAPFDYEALWNANDALADACDPQTVIALLDERDALRQEVTRWKKLGDSVQAERAQALPIIATLRIPDTEDQGGWPVPGASRDTLYALQWAANELTDARAEIARLVGALDAAMCSGCDQTINSGGHSPDCPMQFERADADPRREP